MTEVKKSEAEWKAELDDMAFCVLREHATERPGTSPLPVSWARRCV